jgi:hypothetical protein
MWAYVANRQFALDDARAANPDLDGVDKYRRIGGGV